MQRRNPRGEGRGVQVLADDTGGGHQHVFGYAAHHVGDDAGGAARSLQAHRAGCGVGDAGIDHHGAREAVAHAVQVLAADGYRRRAEDVLGEHAGNRAKLVGLDQSHVKAIGVGAEPGVDAAGAETLGGRDAAVFNGGQVRCIHI